MYREFRDSVDFQMVYIREAHAADEWQKPANIESGVIYTQPTSTEGRLGIANIFQQEFHLEMPLLVDPIEDLAGRAYSAWPERIYVIDPSGKIVYKGGNGPTDFYPEEAREFLETQYLAEFGTKN